MQGTVNFVGEGSDNVGTNKAVEGDIVDMHGEIGVVFVCTSIAQGQQWSSIELATSDVRLLLQQQGYEVEMSQLGNFQLALLLEEGVVIVGEGE